MQDHYALLERIQQGDKLAEKTIIEENMGLVWSVVKRFTGRGYEPDDLSQVGAIGLIKAVKKFDPSFQVQFSTYAVPMIIGEIKRFIRDDGPLKISRSLKEKAIKGWRTEEFLRRKLGREPSIHEIAAESGIEVEDLLEAFDAAAPPESIYESVYDNGGNNIQLLDRLTEGNCEDSIINRVLVDTILKDLKPRERQILILRYFKGRTQSEIAKVIGVSQVQISRIEKNTLEKIRSAMQEDSTCV